MAVQPFILHVWSGKGKYTGTIDVKGGGGGGTPPPVITSGSAYSVAENATLSFIATASQPVSWSLSGPDAAQATVNPTTGAVLVSAQDYETKTFVAFTVHATGPSGSAAMDIVVTVTNQNDTTPIAFSFAPVVDAAPSTQVESGTITIAGLGALDSVTVAVSGAAGSQMSKNGGAWVSGAVTAINGDTFKVRHTTNAGGFSTSVTALVAGETGANFSVTTEAGDEPSVFYSSTFDDAGNPYLRNVGTAPAKWTPRYGGWPGTITEANKATISGGELLISAMTGAEPFCEHYMDTGDIYHSLKLTVGPGPYVVGRMKVVDNNNWLEIPIQANGEIGVGGCVDGNISMFARYYVGTARNPGDTVEGLVGTDGKFRLFVNNVEYDTAPFGVQSVPGNTGYPLPAQLQNGTEVVLKGDQWAARGLQAVEVKTFGSLPISLEVSQFVIVGANRELRMSGRYSGFPDGYSVRVERLNGTVISDYGAMSGTIVGSRFSQSRTFTEAALASGVDQTVRVIIRQNNNPAITASMEILLEDLTKPGVYPFTLGMNTSRAESWLEPLVSRDLVRKGYAVYATKRAPVTNDDMFPVDLLHPLNFYPTSYDGDGGGMIYKIFEQINVTDLGTYVVTKTAGTTVNFPNSSASIVFSGWTGNTCEVTFPAGTNNVTFNIGVNGPIPGDGSGKVTCLPKNDPNPERLYHDQLRGLYETIGAKVFRPMEALMTNDDSYRTAKQFEQVKGDRTGYWHCWVGLVTQFARDTGIMPWYCLHGNATEAHIREVAKQMAKTPGTGGLPLGMQTHIEVDNEPWNGGGTFRGFWHNAARGHKMGLHMGSSIASAVAQPDLVGYNPYGGDFPVVFGDPNPVSENYNPDSRKTKVALVAGNRIMAPIFGTGNNIFEAKQAVPVGTVMPDLQGGVTEDANFRLIANDTLFNTTARRYNIWKTERVRTIFREEWTAAGRNPDDVVVHINRQNASIDFGAPAVTYNADFDYVDPTLKFNNGRRISTGPYYGYSFYNGGTPNLRVTDQNGGSLFGKPIPEVVDTVIMYVPPDAVMRGDNGRKFREALKAAGHPDARWSGYEGRQHYPKNYSDTALVALIQDKRTAVCDALLLTSIGVSSPGEVFCLFSDASDTVLDLWGMFNSMGDYVNPVTWAGKMLKEFRVSYNTHKSVVNVIAPNETPEGTLKIYVARTGKVNIAETIPLIIEAGSAPAMTSGEITGGLPRTVNLAFDANEMLKEVIITTSVTSGKNVRFRIGTPGGGARYMIGEATGAGHNMLVKNVP